MLLSCNMRAVNGGALQRAAALLEVLGVYLAAGAVEDLLIGVLACSKVVSVADPFVLLTNHTTNADLLLASRRLLLIWALQTGRISRSSSR